VAEIDEADRNKRLSTSVTFEESQKLPYLYVELAHLHAPTILTQPPSQAVIKEALRMHPGVGFPLERYIPAEGATICGTELPGGTTVCANAAVIHMNKDVYGDDAAQFRPERWLEASPEQSKLMDRSFLSVSSNQSQYVQALD
jgi:cytochrome P450